MPVEIKGLIEMRAKLRRLAAEFPQEVGRALYQEALIEAKESMRRTPVDTGALRASHETERPKYEGREISVTIKVGGPAAPYALIVHEDLDAYHPVGRSKFLESTIRESKPFLGQRVARRVDLNRLAR
jgi:hypothetical protein